MIRGYDAWKTRSPDDERWEEFEPPDDDEPEPMDDEPMTAIAKMPDKPVAEYKPASLMEVIIERIRAGASLEETREFYAFARQIQADEARIAFAADFAAMQAELPEIPKAGRIDIGKGKPQQYALWEDVNERIKPVLTKYGFGLTFRRAETPDKVTVTAILLHKAGHSDETSVPLPIDASGSKNAVQAYGSALSYGKRYSAGLLLNFTSRGEDDDGRTAGNGNGHLNETQLDELKASTENCDSAWLERFFRFASLNLRREIKGFADIPASKFDWAKDAIKRHRR